MQKNQSIIEIGSLENMFVIGSKICNTILPENLILQSHNNQYSKISNHRNIKTNTSCIIQQTFLFDPMTKFDITLRRVH